jgi:hypothetical protein
MREAAPSSGLSHTDPPRGADMIFPEKRCTPHQARRAPASSAGQALPDHALGDFEPAFAGAFCALRREYPISGLRVLLDGLKAGPVAHVAPDFGLFRIGALLFEAVSHGTRVNRCRVGYQAPPAFTMNPSRNPGGGINVCIRKAAISTPHFIAAGTRVAIAQRCAMNVRS